MSEHDNAPQSPLQPAVEAIAGDGKRDSHGHVGPRNSLALRHGGRRGPVTLETARNSPLYQALVSDRGGEDAISAVEREVIVGFVEATQIRTTAAAYLARTRISMTSDRAQKALATWFKASGDVRSGAQILGLARREREVPSLTSYLAAHDGEIGIRVRRCDIENAWLAGSGCAAVTRTAANVRWAGVQEGSRSAAPSKRFGGPVF